jgi:hypothetical protein
VSFAFGKGIGFLIPEGLVTFNSYEFPFFGVNLLFPLPSCAVSIFPTTLPVLSTISADKSAGSPYGVNASM